MENQFLTYRRFNDPALAEDMIEVLKANSIDYELKDNSIRINPLAYNDALDNEYLIKIKSEDFEAVNNLLVNNEKQHLADVDDDHYLLTFTNDELKDVINKYDEWNAFDVSLARKLLNDRGITVDDQSIQKIKEERLKDLEKPEETQTFWIVIGYAAAFLGGIFGIFIGWHLSRHKKTLPNGKQVYAYLDSDRKQGNRIFILSTVLFIIAIILRFFSDYSRFVRPF